MTLALPFTSACAPTLFSHSTRKDNLVRNMRRMSHVHGSVYSFTPLSFLLPTEYARFVEVSRARPHMRWICKPADASQGQHIFLIRDAGEISSKYYATLRDGKDAGSRKAVRAGSDSSDSEGEDSGPVAGRPGDTQRRQSATGGRAINDEVSIKYTLKALKARLHKTTAPCVAFSRLHIAQQYIDNPALIGGRKFDLRLYALVTSFSPLRVYVYRDAIVRLATARYDLSDLDNAFAHLTNSSINKRSSSDCKRALSHLGPHDGSGAQLVRRPELRQQLAHMVSLTVLSIAAAVPDNGGCFELLGFDVMLDDAGVPHLIEVNASPALSVDGAADVTVKAAMLADMLDVLMTTKLVHAASTAAGAQGRHGQRAPMAASSGRPSLSMAGRAPALERRGSQPQKRGEASAASLRAGSSAQGASADAPALPRRRASASAPLLARMAPVPAAVGKEASIGGWDLAFPFDDATRQLSRTVGGHEAEIVAHIRAASGVTDSGAESQSGAAAAAAAAAPRAPVSDGGRRAASVPVVPPRGRPRSAADWQEQPSLSSAALRARVQAPPGLSRLPNLPPRPRPASAAIVREAISQRSRQQSTAVTVSRAHSFTGGSSGRRLLGLPSAHGPG